MRILRLLVQRQAKPLIWQVCLFPIFLFQIQVCAAGSESRWTRAGMSQLGILGLVACETAYTKGSQWYEAMHAYVKENIEFTRKYVEEKLPGVKMTDHEGTYLVWLDFRETGLSVEELEHRIVYKAGLWLDSGKIFGNLGRGFQRVNVACPRATLTEALERICRVFTD